jgi:putative Mg2+ transporter-C (MgtC) family protein
MNPIDALGLREVILRLAVATAVGGLLGLNRELKGKPAGFRTHALVSLGASVAALGTLASSGSVDPNALSRVIQGVLTGIGFLGAGVILRDTEGRVRGLTTAATVWMATALGIMCGLGYWTVVLIAGLLAYLVLLFGRRVERLGERIVHSSKAGEPRDDGGLT